MDVVGEMTRDLARFDTALPTAQHRLLTLRRETEGLVSIAKANGVEPGGDLLVSYATAWQRLDTLVTDAERDADVVRAFLDSNSANASADVTAAWRSLARATEAIRAELDEAG